MHHLVPELILHNYNAHHDRGEFVAAAMFVDLSGFSNMSDELAKHGHHGSEMLAAVMQSVFEPLVYSVYGHGGFVVGFAGDAITAVFLENDLDSASLRCLSSAVAIEDHFAAHPVRATSFGNFAISVKIGLAYGETIWEIFRATGEKRAAYCFRGAALDGSAAAEHHAKPGQIWLDATFRDKVEPYVRGDVVDGFFRVEASDVPAFDLAMPAPNDQTTRYEDAFFPEALINLEARGEFRPVVNVFIDIPADVQEGEGLQAFMRTVFALQARYGGYFPRPDFGDKGANLLIFWGAPVAYENDIDRALNFILDLRRETGLMISAGISYRLTYAGFIGSALREDYTGYGWGISLAARMMKSAEPGEIWVDEQIARRIEHDYVLGLQQERNFKGFVEKQRIYLLVGRKEVAEMSFTGTFGGREAELNQLAQFAAPLWQGHFAGALVVKGDAGVGKSRLVHEFKESQVFADGKVHWAICQADEIVRQGFNPLRYWLRQRFGISALQSEEDHQRIFATELDRLTSLADDDELRSELNRTSSFLAALLNIYWEGSLYEQLDANGRYENTFIALSVLLRLECLRNPLVLLIEDAHVIDEDTRAFIIYLMRILTLDDARRYPVAILATARLEGPDLVGTPQHAVRELTLGGLGGDALQELATELLGRPVSTGLVNFLEKRAEGNPFFVEQVLRYLQESQLLEERDGFLNIRVADRVELLSTDIQSILITRLDRLTQDVKEVVQSASVLGREFEVRLLLSMLVDQTLPVKIRSAEEAGIWLPLTEIRYIFRHALMRDAAYSMQLHSRQRNLHALAVEAIEQVYTEEIAAHYGELAYHSERANLNDKARRYLELAGDAARDAFANAQAEDYYTRALNRTPENDLETRYQLLMDRESILALQGKQEASSQDLGKLQSLAAQMKDATRIATVLVRQAEKLTNAGSYEQAVFTLENVFEAAHQHEDDNLGLLATQAIAQAFLRLGKYPQGIAYCERGLQIARRGTNRHYDEAALLNTLGMILVEDKDINSSIVHFEQSLSISREINNLRGTAMALSNLGMVAGQVGKFDTALNYYEQALQLAQTMGHRRGEAFVLGNLGWIAGMLGNYAQARIYLERSLQIAREIGNRYSEINALVNLSSTAGALGDYVMAIRYADQAVEIARQSNDRNGEAWAFTYLGHSLFANGELAGAEAAYQKALEIRQTFAQAALASEPGAGLARVFLEQGNLEDGKKHVDAILQHFSNGGTLDGTDEPVRVYLNCYLVLAAVRDERARALLEAGYEQLNRRAASITDVATRQKYFEQVSYNRELLEAWRAITT